MYAGKTQFLRTCAWMIGGIMETDFINMVIVKQIKNCNIYNLEKHN